MKNIIFILLLMLSYSDHKCQSSGNQQIAQPNTCNDYSQYPDNNKFVGTWVGSKNGKTLILKLKNEKVFMREFLQNINFDQQCWDLIYGVHKFTEGNSEIENSLSYFDQNIYSKKWTVLGFAENNLLKGTLEHTFRNKSVNFIIQYIDDTHIKLVSFKNQEGLYYQFPGKPPYDSLISYPEDFILTKQ